MTSRPPATDPPRVLFAPGSSPRLSVRSRAAGELDPLAFLARHESQPRFLHWRGNHAVAGAGVALRLEASGPRRFQEIRDQARAAAEHLTGEPWPRPRWQGAFTFETDQEGGPSAVFVLPRQQLLVEHGRSTLIEVGDTLADRPAAADPGARGSLAWEPQPAFETWATQVREALHAVREGAADKVVLARRVAATTPAPPPLPRVLAHLRAAAPSSSVFLFEPTPSVAFIGASPEVLVEATADRVRTVALAGSRPRGRTPEEDHALERTLLASSKDAWEQELVAKFIRGVLERRGSEWRMTHERRILKLPNVQHLETSFESDPRPGEHVLDLASLLHPTPAVAGYPAAAALPLIARLEERARGAYAGATGWFDADGRGELAVTIRAATVVGRDVTAWAGCGIVNGSDPAEEWEESRTKLQLLVEAFDEEARA